MNKQKPLEYTINNLGTLQQNLTKEDAYNQNLHNQI